MSNILPPNFLESSNGSDYEIASDDEFSVPIQQVNSVVVPDNKVLFDEVKRS